MDNPSTTFEARFNPLIRPYLVLYVAFILAITLVGLPLALIWVLGPGQWWAGHYFERLRCELSGTELRFRKGILFQVEKTIPLENIQDVTFIEGPLLRQFNLSVLRFETAGQSEGNAHAMQLVGVVDAAALRNDILSRRTALRRRAAEASSADPQLQALQAIQQQLETITALLRQRSDAGKDATHG